MNSSPIRKPSRNILKFNKIESKEKLENILEALEYYTKQEKIRIPSKIIAKILRSTNSKMLRIRVYEWLGNLSKEKPHFFHFLSNEILMRMKKAPFPLTKEMDSYILTHYSLYPIEDLQYIGFGDVIINGERYRGRIYFTPYRLIICGWLQYSSASSGMAGSDIFSFVLSLSLGVIDLIVQEAIRQKMELLITSNPNLKDHYTSFTPAFYGRSLPIFSIVSHKITQNYIKWKCKIPKNVLSNTQIDSTHRNRNNEIKISIKIIPKKLKGEKKENFKTRKNLMITTIKNSLDLPPSPP